MKIYFQFIYLYIYIYKVESGLEMSEKNSKKSFSKIYFQNVQKKLGQVQIQKKFPENPIAPQCAQGHSPGMRRKTR